MSEEVIASPPAADGEQGQGAVTAVLPGDTQPATPPTPSTTPQPTSQEQQATGDVTNWEERYKGASRVIAERDKQMATLEAQIKELQGQVGSTSTQLQTAQAEGDARAVTLQEQLDALTQEKTTLTASLGEAQAKLMKFEALKTHPELLPLADAIPNLTDQEALDNYIQMVADGVMKIADEKAQQLTAGITPGAIAPNDQTRLSYNSLEEWQAALNAAAGSDNFTEVAQQFRAWEARQE